VFDAESCNVMWPQGRLDHPIAHVPDPGGPIGLRVEVRGASQQFSGRAFGQEHPLGPAREMLQTSRRGRAGKARVFLAGALLV